ncbi:MAG: AAA family ATPase, partial [Methanothrix sp.]|nr:AAA family ATPase [Methanothrix sp.]
MTRITKISVTNLFRNFNHDIPLRMDDRITIIHGPNGFGKTALLRMLNGVFNARYSVLRTTLFDEFRIDLDNGSTLSVNRFTNTKGRRKQNGNNNNLIFRLRNNKDVLEYSPFTSEQFEEVTAYARMIESYVPELTRIDASSWYYLPTNESLSIEDMVDRFSDYLPSRMARTNKEPEWLTDIRTSIDVRFIETQRLLRSSMTKRGRELD